jgi:prepilin-type N-terminal cleavage/methylation domain-containing protein
MDQPIRRRRGMTLVELLVVVAVLAALVALLLPAVQAAREAARRAACMNNLRHIGCALHGHLLAKRAFPVGCLEFKSGKGGTKRCLAWSAQILPWLEESATAERLRYDLPYDHADNRPAGSAPLGVFVCPAADRIGLLVDGLGRTDYGGIAGERIVSAPLAGPLVHERSFDQPGIPDGLSKTLFVGECSVGAWSDGQWINGRNLFEQAFAVNSTVPFDARRNIWIDDELRSPHPAGALALAGYGAVHFLSASVSLPVLAAACTRAGGEAGSPWNGDP